MKRLLPVLVMGLYAAVQVIAAVAQESHLETGFGTSSHLTVGFATESNLTLGGAAGAGSFTITASTGTHGSIAPSGAVLVNSGDNQTFTMTPDATYNIEDVLVDSVSVGPAASYTFTLVDADHTISVSFSPTATVSTPLAGASVPDTSANWTFVQSAAMPYMFTHSVTVNGTQVQEIAWQYTSTGNFTDTSGNGQDTDPSFPTVSSDPDVSATLTSFAPVDEAQSSGGAGSDSGEDIATPPGAIPNMYTELAITFPGAEVINGLLDASNIPRALFWFPFFMLMIMLLSFLIFWGTKSPFVKAMMLWLMVLLVAALGGWGWWLLIPLAIELLALLLVQKKAGW